MPQMPKTSSYLYLRLRLIKRLIVSFLKLPAWLFKEIYSWLKELKSMVCIHYSSKRLKNVIPAPESLIYIKVLSYLLAAVWCKRVKQGCTHLYAVEAVCYYLISKLVITLFFSCSNVVNVMLVDLSYVAVKSLCDTMKIVVVHMSFVFEYSIF